MSARETVDIDVFFREFAGDPEYEREIAMLRTQTNLAINLHRIRKERGLTQAQLAKRAGMRQPRIAEIEGGDYNPRLDTIAKMAWALGVNGDDLLADPVRTSAATAPVKRTVALIITDPSALPAGGPWSTGRRLDADVRTSAPNDNFALAG
jgi:transcriptional regulator with XRE-family HTH domain